MFMMYGAVGRVLEEWTYGEKKDTEKTSALVPYSELPESENDYDINAAIETLKLIIKLGYNTSKQ